jgi:hypothetical protein
LLIAIYCKRLLHVPIRVTFCIHPGYLLLRDTLRGVCLSERLLVRFRTT